MVILNTKQNGKSVVSNSIYITYSVSYESENELREIQGFVFKDDKNIGFVSYDYIRSSTSFTLNPENGLDATEKKQVFAAFVEDIDELNAD